MASPTFQSFERLRSYVRVRPFIEKEGSTPPENALVARPVIEPCQGPKTPTSSDSDQQTSAFDAIKILDPANKYQPKKGAPVYKSRRVLWSVAPQDDTDPPQMGQDEVFAQIGTPLLDSIVAGYNASLVICGSTKSGKMYTAFGDKEEKGIIPRIVAEILNQIATRRPGHSKTTVDFDFVEVATDQTTMNDLLVGKRTAQQVRDAEALKIRDDPTEGVVIQHAKTTKFDDADACLAAIKTGLAKTTRSKAKNVHLFLTFRFNETLVFEDPQDPDARITKTSRATLNFAVVGGIPTAFQRCLEISAQKEQEGSSARVPTRESSITRLLSEFFGGNSNSILLTCVSPYHGALKEVLPLLDRAQKVRCIRCNAKVQYDNQASEFRKLSTEMSGLTSKVSEASAAQIKVQEELDRRQAILNETSARFNEQESALFQVQSEAALENIVSQVLQRRVLSIQENAREVESSMEKEIQEAEAKNKSTAADVAAKKLELAAAIAASAESATALEQVQIEGAEIQASLDRHEQRREDMKQENEHLAKRDEMVLDHEQQMTQLQQETEAFDEEATKAEQELEPLTTNHKFVKMAHQTVLKEEKEEKEAKDTKAKQKKEEEQLVKDIDQLEKDIAQLEEDCRKQEEENNKCCLLQ